MFRLPMSHQLGMGGGMSWTLKNRDDGGALSAMCFHGTRAGTAHAVEQRWRVKDLRLIDADALKETLIDKVFVNLSDEYYGTMQAVDEAPTIKAWTRAEHNADAFHAYVEGKKSARRHGEWTDVNIYYVSGENAEMQTARCSNCGRHLTTPYFHYSNVYEYYAYCPWCGAKMDGGDKDEID